MGARGVGGTEDLASAVQAQAHRRLVEHRLTAPDRQVHARDRVGHREPAQFSGFSAPAEPVEAVSLRLTSVGRIAKPPARALDTGATATSQPEDMFWGDRFASVMDPYGHNWQFATHVEDLTPEQREERKRQWMASFTGGSSAT